MMNNSTLYIGLMSGTSADGVDAALVHFENNQPTLIDFISPPLPAELQQQLLALNSQPQISLQQLCELEYAVSQVFIDAVNQLLTRNTLTADDIQAIGSHGQTIFHAPAIPMSLQIGHPAFIAKQTGITTAADFRVDDMALQGQGAPFAPAFHVELFQTEQPCFVVNIGGIANISYLPGNHTDKPIGFDTGPGNGLLDEVCQRLLQQAYDKDGEHAQNGAIHQPLLQQLLQHPYFSEPHPKSTGKDVFHYKWLESQLIECGLDITQPSSEDLLATLAEFTAITIGDAIQSVAQDQQQVEATPVWLVGGGAHNTHLLNRIQAQLSCYNVKSSQSIGVDPNAIEAMLFAWLAQQRINQQTVPLSAVTGATRDAILGGVWLP